MNKFLLIVFFISNVSYTQTNILKKIVVDAETLTPLPNVHIYSKLDNTLSNEDGFFTFYSNDNEVVFNHLGYEVLFTTINEIQPKDTIYLKPKLFELNEVVVLDNKNLIKSVYSKIFDNYPTSSFEEESFIRCVLRKDGEIIKMQDLIVAKQQNTLFTTQQNKNLEYSFEIKNLRKAGFLSKDSEDFELLSLNELYSWFSAIFTIPKYYNYIEDSWLDENHVKVNFQKNDELLENASLEGYYIVNNSDFSFKQVKYKTVYNNIDLIPYKNKSNVKWRTIGNELYVDYKKEYSTNKYYVNNAVLKTTVEVINNGYKSIYEVSYQIVNVKINQNQRIKGNVSSKQDMFKINFRYNREFWKNQNQLILDDELTKFIDNLKNLNRKQYKIYTNF